MNLSRFKLWVFDLDGTLIDSRLDLVRAVNATLVSLNLSPLPEQRVVSFVGDGAEDLVYRSLTAAGCPGPEARHILPRTLAWFLDYYGDHCLDATVPYPGAVELLDALQAAGLPLALLTNKPLKPTEAILAHLGWTSRFARVVPGDGPLGKKPDPAGLSYILNEMHALPQDAVLVGDSPQDLLTARAAGTGIVAFRGGLGDPEALAAGSPDLTIDHLPELTALLGSLPARGAAESAA